MGLATRLDLAPDLVIWHGDVRDALRQMPDETVQCVVTSPPYWSLRDYGVPGQLGLEPTPEEYVANMVEVFREVRRVLRKDGTVWLNLGDSYSTVGPDVSDCLNRLIKRSPLVIGNAATIRVTTKRGDIPLQDDRFPDGILLSLLGVERVTIKQRDNDFCQVLYTLAGPRYCWIGLPVARMVRNATDLEIVVDAGYELSIVISHLYPNTEAVFSIPGVLSGASECDDASFAIEKACEPIPKGVGNSQPVRDAFPLNTPLKRFPDIYLVDQAIPLRNGFGSNTGECCDFLVTKASLKELHLTLGNSGVNLTIDSVSHLYTSNEFGSLVRYEELYRKAIEMANEQQAKQELGMPEMVKRALMRDGWICRSTIIWAKPNPMPESVTDRPTKAHEYVFLLAKSERYYYDADAIREPIQEDSLKRYQAGYKGAFKRAREADPRDGRSTGADYGADAFVTSTGRNKRSVWTIPTQPFPEAHFATFPEELPRLCILAGTSPMACPHCGAPWRRVVERVQLEERDDTGRTKSLPDQRMGKSAPPERGWQSERNTIGWEPPCSCEGNDGSGKCWVLDPFLGSGTTAAVALEHGRAAIGCELNAEYIEIAKRRLTKTQTTLLGML